MRFWKDLVAGRVFEHFDVLGTLYANLLGLSFHFALNLTWEATALAVMFVLMIEGVAKTELEFARR